MSDILIIDDSKLNRAVLARRFAATRHKVRLAENGEAGRQEIKRSLPNLIILDEMMPGISGRDLLLELRSTYSLNELPIIMLTARDESSELVQALHFGANDFIVKGADFEEILARVETHLKLQKLSNLQDEFLRIASHDLKNPISTIRGQIQLLLLEKDIFSPEERRQMIESIGRRTDEMMSTVERFLDRSKEEEGPRMLLETLNIDTVIQEVVEGQRDYAIQKSITLHWAPQDGLIVRIDRDGLLQALHNVVGNAIKYGPANSTITLRVETKENLILVHTEDQGPGIPEDRIDQVFDKFCDVGNKPTGDEKSTGLGMYIARKALLRQGGQIQIKNLPGRGCCFTITLPQDQARKTTDR